MKRQCTGNGLIFAGLIVTFVGLALVAAKTWHIDRQWVPVLVGVGLLALGLTRRLTGSGDETKGSGQP